MFIALHGSARLGPGSLVVTAIGLLVFQSCSGRRCSPG